MHSFYIFLKYRFFLIKFSAKYKLDIFSWNSHCKPRLSQILFYCAKIFTCTVKQLKHFIKSISVDKESVWVVHVHGQKVKAFIQANTTALRKTWILYWRFVYKRRLKWVRNLTVWNAGLNWTQDVPLCGSGLVCDGPARGRSSNEHIHTHSLPTKTVVAPNSIPLNPESCCSPKLKLLFSYCERLFHLDLAAVMDHDVLERFISPICLCALNLSHHILEDSRTISTVTGVNALLGVWRNG